MPDNKYLIIGGDDGDAAVAGIRQVDPDGSNRPDQRRTSPPTTARRSPKACGKASLSRKYFARLPKKAWTSTWACALSPRPGQAGVDEQVLT
jgi:hypothetical protein